MSECDICGSTDVGATNTYCSRKCAGKANRTGKYVDCDNCNEEIWREPNELERRKNNFCSKSCHDQYQQNSETTICNYCKEEFEHLPSDDRKYCSKECSGKDRRDRVNTPCSNCGNIVTRNKKYASKYKNLFCSNKCRSEWLSENSLFAIDNPNFKDGRYGEFGRNWPEMRDKIIKRSNNICQKCGKTKEKNGRNMSVHHIKPRSEFIESDDLTLEDSNTLDNLVALCRSCHMEEEHKVIN